MSVLKEITMRGYALLKNPQRDLSLFVAETNDLATDFIAQNQKEEKPQQLIGARVGRKALPDYPDVFLSSGHESVYPLPLHGELYYQRKDPPEMLSFFCQTPPKEHGETLLCDGIKLFSMLSSASQKLFLNQKIVYTRYTPEKLWKKEYATENSDALLYFLRRNDIHGTLDCDKELKTTFVTSAVRSLHGQYVFINNLIPFAVREYSEPDATRSRVNFENGDAISLRLLNEILDVTKKTQILIRWNVGDLLIVDNRRVLHGRDLLAAGPRTIYLRMGSFKSDLKSGL